MSARTFSVVASLLPCFLLVVRPAAAQRPISGPDVGYPLEFKSSPPVRTMPPKAQAPGQPREVPEHHLPARPRPPKATDPVLQTSTTIPAAAQSSTQWEGLGAGFSGFTVSAIPPDTNMAVGPNHVVQWVNGAFVVFSKQGVPLIQPVADSTFWGTLSSCYQGGGFSDPIVQYDRAADRWLVGEVAIPLLPPFFGQYAQCFAVSATSDPSGSYYMWAYGFGSDINDYPKIGVWPDGYYVTWNMFQGGATFSGPRSCSFARSAMLSGASSPARVCFQLSTANDSLLPADLDGATPPPGGSPNFQMNVNTGTGALNLWKFHVDFASPNNSTFTGAIALAGVAPFNAPCPTTQDCIPQPGTTTTLDAIGDRLMYRLAYRNFGDHESIVANHTVSSAGGNTGVRWYEVRNPNGTPAIYQQGSFAPDTNNRWMASVAMDKKGNVGIGYNVASATTYPSIRYTGWEVGNPLGDLQAETPLVAGGGSQTGYDRWGDYSAMRIDPSDDCTFWYTQEYQATTQDANWSTRIGSFRFPSCGQTAVPTTTTLASSQNPSSYAQQVTFTATVAASSGSGTATGTVTFKDGSAVLGSSSVNASGAATFATSSLTAGSHAITAVYGGDPTYNGSTSSALAQTVSQIGTATTLTSSVNPANYGQSVTLTATVLSAAATGTVQFLDGATVLGSATLSGGQASLSTSSLSGGSHSMTARYVGDTNYAGSTSAVLVQTVTQIGTTTAVNSSASTSTYGQAVTFTATVTPSSGAAKPTGTVQFRDGGTALGSAALNSNGVGIFSATSLSVGGHSITAQYAGDNNFSGSTSVALIQTVNKANTTTALASSSNPSNTGQTVTFTATLSSSAATGSVQFFDGAQSLGAAPLSDGKATLSTAFTTSGKHSITATYGGDTNFNGSTSAALSQNVRRKN